ncbi:Low affinity cationic amino acid transporter 2 protein [Paragonimus westermani]|uniref:Low affinity cationic amino acid transporter 2 protein n=1 Tax=Paragonimus westermani TaxID=34504 RepID=A0A8T0D2R0_9TREM|nr:Low affinity cationic amino acid transporter 2 protein [Paragonimus westermani]
MHVYCSFTLLILSMLMDGYTCMECYVCRNQEGNRDKCIRTTMQCLEDQLSCITNISYTIPPYWSPLGERTHFIWKACISTAECERLMEEAGQYCQREWFMDWRCVECCQGELCNYYVTVSDLAYKSEHVEIV